MKIYEIYDEENELSIGVLIYYEKEKSYIIELQTNLDEWTSPLLFTAYIKQNIYTIPKEIAFLWVKERVIPSGRQNINEILTHHSMKEYNEMTLLEISEGRCSQDNMCIKRLNDLPVFVRKRALKNVIECIVTSDNKLMCIFANDVIKKISLEDLAYVDGVEKILKNPRLFNSAKVSTGGYAITFNDSIDIPAYALYKEGKTVPLTPIDLLAFVQRNVIDTSEACDTLGCSRQNLSYLVKEGQLKAVKENVKGNIYLKGDVLKCLW